MNAIYVLIVAHVLNGAQMQEFSSFERCETAKQFVEESIKGKSLPDICNLNDRNSLIQCLPRVYVSFEAKCVKK